MTKATGKMSRTERKAQWIGILERFEHHTGSVKSFCHQEGISVASLYHWRKKLREVRSSGFVELRAGGESESGPGVQVRLLHKGIELCLPAHWSEQRLLSFIKALEQW